MVAVDPGAVGGAVVLVALGAGGWMVVVVDPVDVKKEKKKKLGLHG